MGEAAVSAIRTFFSWLVIGVLAIVAVILIPLSGLVGGEALSAIGTFFSGLATVALAIAALYGAFVAFRQFTTQRASQIALDLVKLQADLVALYREQYQRTSDPAEKAAVLTDLEKAEDDYEGILRGRMIRDPEMAQARRVYLSATLEELARERQHIEEELRGGGL